MNIILKFIFYTIAASLVSCAAVMMYAVDSPAGSMQLRRSAPLEHAASSQAIASPTEEQCRYLKMDLDSIANYVRSERSQEQLLNSLLPPEVIDATYGPGTSARIIGLINGAFAARSNLPAWVTAEYARCAASFPREPDVPESSSSLSIRRTT